MKHWTRKGPLADVEPISHKARRLHRLIPGFAPTPLRDCDALADATDVGRVWVKDESNRLGLPAYKALGGVWAVCRMCSDALGRDLSRCASWAELLDAVEPLRPRRLVTATDGNHGRGVARVAKWLGLDCTVFLPSHTVRARIDAIRDEGAEVVVHAGDYDAAVAAALVAAARDSRAWLVQDTVIGKHADPARWCAEGYVTIFEEIDEEHLQLGDLAPDVFLIPIGVGTLADAMVRCVRNTPRWAHTRLVGVEPAGAACALASLEAGEMRPAAGDGRTIMAGLNCPTLSPVAWPTIRDGLDACVAIEDEFAEQAMRLLHESGIVSGESGASGVAALMAIARDDAARAALGIGAEDSVLVLNTEGATDPESYARIVGVASGR